jgi:hypothetical protein
MMECWKSPVLTVLGEWWELEFSTLLVGLAD